MRRSFPQLVILLLAMGFSALPASFFQQGQSGREAELLCLQRTGDTEFIPVAMESEAQLSKAQPCLVVLHQQAAILPDKPAPYRNILCKKAFSSGQVCAFLPLRL